MRILPIIFILALALPSCISDEVQKEQDSLLSLLDTPGVDTFSVIKPAPLSLEEKQDSAEARQIVTEASDVINPGASESGDKIATASAFVKDPDVAASFPGGQAAMEQYLNRKLVYPLVAFQNEIKGVVLVSAVIESDGKIGGVNVKKGLGYGCDEAAADCIRAMPNWLPAQKGGVNVRTMVTIPVTFRIRE